MGDLVVVACGLAAGVLAGRVASRVLLNLRAPVRVPPVVCEAALGAAWALLAWRMAAGAVPPWWLPVPAALAWLAVVLVATDVRHRLLPNAVTLPAYPAFAVLLAVAAAAGPEPGLATRAAVGAVVLGAVHAAVHLAAPGQLGAGDVKLAGLVGAVLGAVSWPAVLLGPVVAAAVTVAVAVATRGRTAPHGPGLLAAALLVAAFPAAFSAAFPGAGAAAGAAVGAAL